MVEERRLGGRTVGERLAVLEDNMEKVEGRIDKDGEHIWKAITDLRRCFTNSNAALREHLDSKFGSLYALLIKGGGVIVTIMLGMIGYLFIKTMGW